MYHQLLSENRQQNVNRERIIEMFIREAGDDIELLRAYLRGKVPVDRLYPIAEQIQEEYFLDAYTETDCLMEYLELFEDEPFHRRCEAYMMLRRSGHFCFFGGYGRFVPAKSTKAFSESGPRRLYGYPSVCRSYDDAGILGRL